VLMSALFLKSGLCLCPVYLPGHGNLIDYE
jgi:hypothetical protein